MPEEHDYEVEDRGTYILVSQRGLLPSVAAARVLQTRVERALAESGCTVAVFDNRHTEVPPDEVRQSMFEWAIGGTFTRVGLVVDGELVAVRATMESIASGRRLKAFNALDEAVTWVEAE